MPKLNSLAQGSKPLRKVPADHALFDLEEEQVLAEVRRLGVKRLLIQAPEGLKPYAASLAELVERETGCRAYISGSPCFGACNLALREAEALKAELLVHLGHTELVPARAVKVLYVEARSNIDLIPAAEKSLPLLEPYRRIGLLTTVQHAHRLAEAKRLLESRGKEVHVSRGSERVKYPGQVIGCDYTSAERVQGCVEAFLFLGGGLFHPLGAALKTGIPVIAADPFTGEVKDLKETARRVQRQRYAAIEAAKKARSFGVLSSIEPGQANPSFAETLAEKLRSHGKEAYLISVSIVDPGELEAFTNIDAYVNTACPRLGLEDSPRFSKPILNAEEALILLGEASWGEYIKEPA
ncbi:MAG: diphthamide biosynthesis enzyme Dph2 [Candidatus Bathyarchaeia archaeon]